MIKVVCFAVVFVLLVTNAQGQGRGALRFYNNGQTSTSLTKGIVQIFYNSKWSNICDKDSTGTYTPNTICRQLGYSSGKTVNNSVYGTDPANAAISDVTCYSNSLSVLQCLLSTDVSECTSANDVAVQCEDTPFPFAGKVRLTGNTEYSGSGRVEVYCNGEWGLVCNTGFNSYDANTVCRQLGYTKAINYSGNYGNGNGTQNVWLNRPGCGVNTKCLSNCKNCPTFETSACSVNSVVGVTCSYEDNDAFSGTYDYCLFSDASTSSIVAIVVGVIVGLFVCVVAAIAIPFLICCCLGVGIGAAARRRVGPRAYSTI